MRRNADLPPPDQRQREQIVTELDRNLLVEASAGSGKTTSMVQRMVAIGRGGHCSISQRAAVSVGRKAAADLGGRCRIRGGLYLLEMGAQGMLLPRAPSAA